ncbi:IreB family regulatory phosphoprotein [Alkalicoccus luteus]|uniref:UPF0297 protein HCN83_02975 n=1 Tax=Alkalicoccus luteus TaxID=1237094 RepID=A0A969PLT8_9BACI|nr:IreB family regulatory phosphoprotein [Alkalicoccus luteus]NJP36551.1 IreB family regulatory phosphoprotein [Alkalicoccus luteus]
MSSMDKTMKFNFNDDSMDRQVREVLESVYGSLEEKGYNPINQIVGYLLSGDPAYIPRHNEARTMIRRLERDEMIEALVRSYLKDGNKA